MINVTSGYLQTSGWDPYNPWAPVTPQPQPQIVVWPGWIVYNNDVAKSQLEALEKRVAELEAKLAKKRAKKPDAG